MSALINEHGWSAKYTSPKGEVLAVQKLIGRYWYEIRVEISYFILELVSSPVESLEDLEIQHFHVFTDVRAVLRTLDLMIWPFGVAPASTGCLFPAESTREDIIEDGFYSIWDRCKPIRRHCHIFSQQVAVDVAVKKLIPAINALYKNLGTIMSRFANAKVLKDGRAYHEGGYYWWLESPHESTGPKYDHGGILIFPKCEFVDFSDFYERVWHTAHVMVMRDGRLHYSADDSLTWHRFIQQKSCTLLNEQGQKVSIDLEVSDLNWMFHVPTIDFKPHYKFSDAMSLDRFLELYSSKDINGFMHEFCRRAWIEIKPCSPHYENNAMDIPRYFYEIFENIDSYVSDSQSITWDQARVNRNRAIGYADNHVGTEF